MFWMIGCFDSCMQFNYFVQDFYAASCCFLGFFSSVCSQFLPKISRKITLKVRKELQEIFYVEFFSEG